MMSIGFSIAKMFITDQIKGKINIQLNNIQDSCDWNKFVVGIPLDKIKISQSNYAEVLKEKDLWEELAKVSIDLWIDYDHYRRFNFKSQYCSKEHSERLENLGFECDDGRWQSVRKPSVDEVQVNVFMYCLYRAISSEMGMEEMHQNNENERRQVSTNVSRDSSVDRKCNETMESGKIITNNVAQIYDLDSTIICSFCDNVIAPGEYKCSVCDGLVEELEAPRNKSAEEGLIRRSSSSITEQRGNLMDAFRAPDVSAYDDTSCWNSRLDDGAASSENTGEAKKGNQKEGAEKWHSPSQRDHNSDDNGLGFDYSKRDKDVNIGEGTKGRQNEEGGKGFSLRQKEIISDNDSTWQCPSCTYKNPASNQTCGVCFECKYVGYSLNGAKESNDENERRFKSARENVREMKGENDGMKSERRDDGVNNFFQATPVINNRGYSVGPFGMIIDSDSRDFGAREQSGSTRNNKKSGNAYYKKHVVNNSFTKYKGSDEGSRGSGGGKFNQTSRNRGMDRRGPQSFNQNLTKSFSPDDVPYQTPYSYDYEEKPQRSSRPPQNRPNSSVYRRNSGD